MPIVIILLIIVIEITTITILNEPPGRGDDDLGRGYRNPRPQLEPQIASFRKCDTN